MGATVATYSETVTDDSGYQRPVEGAVVYLLSNDDSEALIAADLNPVRTDAYGVFRFTGVPDGQYRRDVRFGGVSYDKATVIVGEPPEYKGNRGDAGPAGPTFDDLSDFRAAPSSNQKQALADPAYPQGDYFFETAAAPYVERLPYVIKANDTALSVGAWVRQGAAGITVRNTKGGQAVYAAAKSVDDLLNVPKTNIAAYANGPVELENAFDLLNRATGANKSYSGNDSDLPRWIDIDVPLVFPGENRSVFVPRGVILGFSNGRQMDASALVGNNKDLFVLGRQADGSINPGGLPPRLLFLNIIGGPASRAIISTDGVQGYTIFGGFITAAGTALDMRGSDDGIVDDLQTDGCLTGLLLGGKNHNIGILKGFNNSYDVRVSSNTIDCEIDNISSAYPRTASYQTEDGATNIRAVHVGRHKVVMNGQYETFTGCINMRSNAADITFGTADYRNIKGVAVVSASGLANRLDIGRLLLDGRRTKDFAPAYDQSPDMGGVDFMNGTLSIGHTLARFLPQQPIRIRGGFQTMAEIGGAYFEGCTGGSSEISIESTGAGSNVQLYNTYSSRGADKRYFNSGTGTVGGLT